MSADRVEVEPEYLTVSGVAERLGIKRDTIHGYLSRGSMPEPDLVFVRNPLWLVSTIDSWRANKGKRRLIVPRREKIRTQPTTPVRPPRLAAPSSSSAPAKAPNRKLAAPVHRDVSSSAATTVSPHVAKQLAASLRGEGVYCTTEDVLALADTDGPLGHERELLRARIMAKLRGLRARQAEN